MAVICELLGVPDPERVQVREWTQVLFSHVATAEQAYTAHYGLNQYLADLVHEKRRSPADDLTTALTRRRDDDELSPQELVDNLFLLIVAGHETTVHLLGHAIVSLLGDPSQLALAIAGERWGHVVEETLRRTPPVAGAIFRYALRPVELAGVSIAAGDALLLCLGAPLTRLEGEMGLSALFGRLPGMKPAIALEDISYSLSFLTYGSLALPVFTEG